MIMPLSERFTRSTWAHCASIGMFLWMIPIPPSRAMAIAIRCSVTVSMAAETRGAARWMPRAKRAPIDTSAG